jgi:hypothetical protein
MSFGVAWIGPGNCVTCGHIDGHATWCAEVNEWLASLVPRGNDLFVRMSHAEHVRVGRLGGLAKARNRRSVMT